VFGGILQWGDENVMAQLPQIFFTGDIVEILEIEEWRVLKFAEGKEYQIRPAQSQAQGSGSRRLYDLENVCEIALAVQLLDAGLAPKAIGEILQRLKSAVNPEEISSKLELPDSKLGALQLVVLRLPKRSRFSFKVRDREVFFASDLTEARVESAERPEMDFLLVGVGRAFQKLNKRLKSFQQKKEKKHGSV
jgi:DNA-binding transcriptional MerR regulator